MMRLFFLWLRTGSACTGAVRTGRRTRGRRPGGWRRSFVPRFDVLEDRTLPSTLTVMNLNDSGTGSLRAAISAANAQPGDTIDFANGLHGTITLTSGEMLISNSVTINGPGTNQQSISGNNSSRIFEIANNPMLNVTINDLTITHGHSQGGIYYGE